MKNNVTLASIAFFLVFGAILFSPFVFAQSSPPSQSLCSMSPSTPYYSKYCGGGSSPSRPLKRPAQPKPTPIPCHSTPAHCKAGEPNYEIGPSIAELKKQEKAERDQKQAYEFVQEGWTLAQQGNFVDAVTLYDRAIELYRWPNWVQLRMNALWRLRRYDEAIRDAQWVLENDSVPSEIAVAKAIKSNIEFEMTNPLYAAGLMSRDLGDSLLRKPPPSPWIKGKDWVGRVFSTGPFQITTKDGLVVTRPDQIRGISLANAHVTTGKNCILQILLPDETIFTLGPNSDMSVDTFVYDAAANTEEVNTRFTSGMVRFVSGRTAQEKVTIKTPVGVLGPRGTDLEIWINDKQWGILIQFSGQSVISPGGNDLTEPLVIEPGHFTDFAFDKMNPRIFYFGEKCTDAECLNAFAIH